MGISGTSAGAMNAGLLADGLRRGGASQRAAGSTSILERCRPPAGIRDPVATGSAAHVAPRPQPDLPLGGHADAGLVAIPDQLLELPSASGSCCSASTSKGCAMMCAHRASSSAQRTYAPDCVACSTMPNYQLTCCSPRHACRRCIKRSRSGTTSIGMAATPETLRSPPLSRHERHRSDRRGHQPDGTHDRAADGAWHHRPHRRDQLQLDLHAGVWGS